MVKHTKYQNVHRIYVKCKLLYIHFHAYYQFHQGPFLWFICYYGMDKNLPIVYVEFNDSAKL